MALPYTIEPEWEEALKEELKKPYIKDLENFLKKEELSGRKIYPAKGNVFSALSKTPLSQVKVVIIGQDPYHGPGQAHGLCFSVNDGVAFPPSLQNIFKELQSDIGMRTPKSGNLSPWAKQGVLLLNATLTVSESSPLSHHNKGWERFTDSIVEQIAKKNTPVIYLLWGKSAQDKCLKIPQITTNKNSYILKAPHPSPLSAHRGFLGCKHFSKTNEILYNLNLPLIDWRL